VAARPALRGVGGGAGRVSTELGSAEAELRYLDRLIARLDDHFACHGDNGTSR